MTIEIIEIDKNINHKILSKLTFLCNHLVQYHAINYDEVIWREKDGDITNDIIYFKPKNAIPGHLKDITKIYNIITSFIIKGYVTKDDMRTANEIWEELKSTCELGGQAIE